MKRNVDPNLFGLPGRTVIEQVDAKTFAIVIDRKSRIIMADGRKIRDKAAKMKQVLADISVVVKTSAPVCSKTLRFLEEENIQVESIP